jgi:hypothetical protein
VNQERRSISPIENHGLNLDPIKLNTKTFVVIARVWWQPGTLQDKQRIEQRPAQNVLLLKLELQQPQHQTID